MIDPQTISAADLSKTAILVFSRSAAEEAEHKPLSPDTGLNVGVYNALIKHTRQLATEAGIPCIWVGSDQQRGASFGDRLTNAFESAFEAGFTSVIAIGNDCPSLEVGDLLSAKEALEADNAILGPSRDGGTWLIGLTATQFDRLPFKKLPWKSADLYSAFASSLRNLNFSIITLERKGDVDRRTDLSEVLAELPVDHILRRKIQLLLLLIEAPSNMEPIEPTVLWDAPDTALRAPPVGC